MLDSLLEECPEEMPDRMQILSSLAQHNPRNERPLGGFIGRFGQLIPEAEIIRIKGIAYKKPQEQALDITCSGCEKNCGMRATTNMSAVDQRKAVRAFMKRSYSCPSAVC